MAGRVIAALLVAAFGVGCTVRMLDFTVVSSKNTSIQASSYGQRTEGRDCAHLLLGLIPLTGRFQPHMKEAIDRAIEAAGPGYDALVDGVIENSFFTVILYAQGCFIVEGTPINTHEAAANDVGRVYRHSSR